MLFLSVIFTLSNLSFAAHSESTVKSFFSNYVQSVSKNTFDSKAYIDSFKPIIKDDKKIFSPCLRNKCSVKVKITKMKNKNNLWKLQAKTFYTIKNIHKEITSRQGCYFVINKNNTLKLANYIDECNER